MSNIEQQILDSKLLRLRDRIDDTAKKNMVLLVHYFNNEYILLCLRLFGKHKILIAQNIENDLDILIWQDRELEDSDLAVGLQSLIGEALYVEPFVLGDD